MSDDPNAPKPPGRASRTQEGRLRLRAYSLALGEFVDAFARAERDMHVVLRWHTKTPDKVARAVFSGVRTSEASNFLRRLHTAEIIDAAEWAELEPVIVQLGKLNDARNLILHYGADQVAEGEGIATNRSIALPEEAAKTIPISPGILRRMSWDIAKIRTHLRARHMGRRLLRGQRPDIDEMLHAAWRYIPPPQATKRPSADKSRRKLNPDKRQPQRLPPKASPE
jgi:hypothetical protein